jgi:hypothetical protein
LSEKSKVRQNICEINKQLKLVFEILNEIIVMNECLNKVNVWDDIKIFKIVINKVNKMNSYETIDEMKESLFNCVWPQI